MKISEIKEGNLPIFDNEEFLEYLPNLDDGVKHKI
jgi:hypothetical protein